MSDYHECSSREMCDDARAERAELEKERDALAARLAEAERDRDSYRATANDLAVRVAGLGRCPSCGRKVLQRIREPYRRLRQIAPLDLESAFTSAYFPLRPKR